MTTITEFTNSIRHIFPETIRQATAGDVEQIEDRELIAWTATGEAAFEIVLSDGSSYQITIRQTAKASEECPLCSADVDPEEIAEFGICAGCFATFENGYDVLEPYDYYRGAA